MKIGKIIDSLIPDSTLGIFIFSFIMAILIVIPMTIFLVYGHTLHRADNIICDKRYIYKDVNVCETNSPLTKEGWVYDLLMGGGVVSSDPSMIYIKPWDINKEISLKHEYCHILQIRENRSFNEIECYQKMWFS